MGYTRKTTTIQVGLSVTWIQGKLELYDVAYNTNTVQTWLATWDPKPF